MLSICDRLLYMWLNVTDRQTDAYIYQSQNVTDAELTSFFPYYFANTWENYFEMCLFVCCVLYCFATSVQES